MGRAPAHVARGPESALLSWLSKQPWATESRLGLSCVEMLGHKPWPEWEELTGVNWFQVPFL